MVMGINKIWFELRNCFKVEIIKPNDRLSIIGSVSRKSQINIMLHKNNNVQRASFDFAMLSKEKYGDKDRT